MKFYLFCAGMLVGSGLAVLIFPDYVNVSPVSILPVLFAVVLFLNLLYDAYRRKHRPRIIKYDGRMKTLITRTRDTWDIKFSVKMLIGNLFLFLPCVLFFNDLAKIFLALLLYVLILFGCLLHTAKIMKKEAEQKQREQERERKAQQAREELGRWK